jgi:Protein of unknown function (DUF4435)
MSFIDTLRAARRSQVSILHEFLSQYDPQARRVHAFFEGHDDIAFFVPHIERYLPPGTRLIRYTCEGKPRVFETFEQIMRRMPEVRHTLFFVDKDLDDVLGTPWPTDPRIFVTDVYSIENYIVTSGVLMKFYRDNVKLRGVTFPDDVIERHFENQLARFQKQILCIMAWILVLRRSGSRPNLNGLNLDLMWRFTSSGVPRPMCGQRLRSLILQTSATVPTISLGRLKEAKRELQRMPIKRVLRGKFEAWFLLRFWQRLIEQLQTATREAGGNVKIKVQLNQYNLVQVLASYLETPSSLDMFLRAHLASGLIVSSETGEVQEADGWFARLVNWFFNG